MLPDTAKDKPARGKIIAVGDGRIMKDGSRAPLQVKAGNRVLFSLTRAIRSSSAIGNYCSMREEDILAIIE